MNRLLGRVDSVSLAKVKAFLKKGVVREFDDYESPGPVSRDAHGGGLGEAIRKEFLDSSQSRVYSLKELGRVGFLGGLGGLGELLREGGLWRWGYGALELKL